MGRVSARLWGNTLCRGRLKPALVFALAACAGVARDDSNSIRWLGDARPPAVEVVDRGGRGALAVFAEQDSAKSMPPMAGTLRRVDGRLRFEPQFPFVRGVRYRAEYRASAGAAPEISFFEVPAAAETAATRVVQVYPTADVLPENQLKFYVHFSAPMSRRGIYEHVHIRDAAGRVIELPFLELDEELWDPAMTRLTLLIDPGRIKRGVKPLEDIGPVFEAGKSYTLVVDAAFRDATGRPLGAAFEKKFLAGPADRAPPDPQRWKIHPPAAGTREPLVVEFDEPIDHALALRLIGVRRADEALAGDTALDCAEQRWSFTPGQPWVRSAHQLTIATTIEDLAGNNVGKPFDVDVFERVERRVETPVVGVEFSVR